MKGNDCQASAPESEPATGRIVQLERFPIADSAEYSAAYFALFEYNFTNKTAGGSLRTTTACLFSDPGTRGQSRISALGNSPSRKSCNARSASLDIKSLSFTEPTMKESTTPLTVASTLSGI